MQFSGRSCLLGKWEAWFSPESEDWEDGAVRREEKKSEMT